MHLIGNTKRNFKKLVIIIGLIFAMIFPFAGYIKSTSRIIDAKAVTNAVVTKAESRIGSRYVYGACHTYRQLRNRRQRAFDCSGLVNWTYYQAGHSIGINTSYTLRRKGTRVSFRHLRAGDVVLFNGHAGVYIGAGRMIHAPNRRSRVKVTYLDRYWRRRFRCGRRIIHQTSYRTIAKSTSKYKTGATKRSITSRPVRNYSAGTYKLNLTMCIRQSPRLGGRYISYYKKGTIIRTRTVKNHKWAQIMYKGRICYVSLRYSTKIK